ncbi:hypothetical protein Tco_1528844 [Tanacetum coccineum]
MSLNTGSTKSKNNLRENSFNKRENHNNKGSNNASNSYAHAVKVGPKSVEAEVDNIPALVLDEDCLNQQEYSNSLLGKVKELNTLSNLKMVLVNKGFDNIDIKYMGGYWVMIEFQSEETKRKFTASVGVGVWFSQLQQASKEFTLDRRVTWVCWIRAKEVPGWTPEFVENNEDVDTDDESYERDSVGEKGGLNGTSNLEGDSDSEEDPFHIYDLLNKKQCDNNKELNSYDSLKYPSGFTPIGTTEAHSNKCAESKQEGDDDSHSNKEEEGGSILQLMDDLVKVGLTIGFNMEGCMKNMEEIIESQGGNVVHR